MHGTTTHRFRRLGRYVFGLCAVLLSACAAVGPDYQQPNLLLPVAWSEAQTGVAEADLPRMHLWWQGFGDDLLDRLATQALVNNQDLGIARARLRQARAEREQVTSGLRPRVATGGGVQALRSSRALDWPPGIGDSRTYRAGFDASWELDMFGGNRRAIEAADAQVEAMAEERYALEVSLLAELVMNYVRLRASQERLAIAHDNIRTLEDGELLAERALRNGLGTSIDLAQARAERETAEAQPPALEADIARLSHTIGVLTGGFPDDWRSMLVKEAAALPTIPALPSALPSEVIRNRPDLRASERQLAAATARIGTAEAERFPRFSIPLGLGTTASLLHDLFSGASLAWSMGMDASHTLYDGGRAQAGVSAAQAAADAARLAYQRDVRLALRDVEDALTGLNSERQRQIALAAALKESQQALEHASRLYRNGLSGYLPVLNAQRSFNQARDALALNHLAQSMGAIALHKALGAGWQRND